MKFTPFNFLKNTRYMQYLAATTSTLSMTASACYFTWPSPTLPLLKSEDSPIGVTITDEEGSWIVSIFLLSSLPFYFVAGWMADKIGRRLTLLSVALPLAVPWIITIYAESTAVLYVARSIGGFGMAVAIVVCPMYNGEISDHDIRGRLGTMTTIMRLAGSIIVLSVGPFVSYVALALICLSLSLIFFVTFYFMPESPYYFIATGKKMKASKALCTITSKEETKESIEAKLEEIELTVEQDMKNKSSMLELFTNKEYRRSLNVITWIKTLQQLSGQNAIEPYMQSIVQSSGSSISAEVSSILFGFVQLISVLLAGILVDKTGRKPLMILSSVGSAVALIAEGVYFYIQDALQGDLENLSWLPTTGIVAYLFMNFLGVGTLPYVLTGEMFATNIKGQGTAFISFYSAVLAFFLAKYFQPLSNEIGVYSTFWIFACCCILGAIYVHFFVPETKGKSFAEIQRELMGNKKYDSRSEDRI